jgi:hypothetical protein
VISSAVSSTSVVTPVEQSTMSFVAMIFS